MPRQTVPHLKSLLDQLKAVDAALAEAQNRADGVLPAEMQRRISASRENMAGLDAAIRRVYWDLTEPAPIRRPVGLGGAAGTGSAA